MKLYAYESHLGGVYFDKKYNESWLKTCNQCGDSDHCFGSFESSSKFIEFMKDEDGFIPYVEQTIEKDWQEEEGTGNE